MKADTLAPLAKEDDPPFLEAWVSWAGRVTVRRLRDDVEDALTLAETDPEVFRRGGGLPAEAHREIGATAKEAEKDHLEASRDPFVPFVSSWQTPDREIGATAKAPEEDTVERVWAVGKGRYDHGPRKSAPDEICEVSFVGPPETIQLFTAVLSKVRRRLGAETGRLPTPGQALAAMLDHALESECRGFGAVAGRRRVLNRP